MDFPPLISEFLPLVRLITPSTFNRSHLTDFRFHSFSHHSSQRLHYMTGLHHAAAEALVNLYAQKGHDLHACRRFLRDKKIRVLPCSFSAPSTASCVCHTLVLRAFHLSPFHLHRDRSFATSRGAERTCKALPNEALCKILGSGS